MGRTAQTLCFLALLAPSTGIADTVTTSFIEHHDYTRLILEFPQRASWEILAQESAVEIVVSSDLDLTLDTESKIPPDSRLKAVYLSSHKIILDLSCSCEVQGQNFGDRYAIFDIIDPIDSIATPIFTVPQNVLGSNILPDLLAWDTQPYLSANLDNTFAHPHKTPETAKVRIAQHTENYLSKTIERGALQDLTVRIDEEGSIEGKNLDIYHDRIQNLNSQTSIERDIQLPTSQTETSPSGEVCIQDEDFDVNAWGGADPWQAYQAAVDQLSAEDGIPTDAGRLQLARAQIALGLGSEAERVLKGIEQQHYPILMDLAKLIEGRATVWSGWLDQLDCPSRVSLWAMLATRRAPKATSIVIEHLFELPSPVRKLVAYHLAEIFHEAKDQANFDIIVAEMQRSNGDNDAAVQLLIAYNRYNKTSYEDLKDIEVFTDKSNLVSAKALVYTINAKLDSDSRLTLHEIEELGSFKRLLRNTAFSDRLIDLEIRSKIALQQLVYDVEYRDYLHRTKNSEIVKQIKEYIALSSDNIFLSFAIELPEIVLSDLSNSHYKKIIEDRIAEVKIEALDQSYIYSENLGEVISRQMKHNKQYSSESNKENSSSPAEFFETNNQTESAHNEKTKVERVNNRFSALRAASNAEDFETLVDLSSKFRTASREIK